VPPKNRQVIIDVKPSVISNQSSLPIYAFGVNTNTGQSGNAKDQITVALNIKDPRKDKN
jgi:hypothetical protein